MKDLIKRSEMGKVACILGKDTASYDPAATLFACREGILSALAGKSCREGALAQGALAALAVHLKHHDPASLSVVAPREIEESVRKFFAGIADPEGTRERISPFDFGHDGQILTRETAAKLHLIRFFEVASSRYDRLVARGFSLIARYREATLAWSRRMPFLLADMTDPRQRDAAYKLSDLAGGELLVVTPEAGPQPARGPDALACVIDPANLFYKLLGHYGYPMLAERRMGGWSVMFPVGGADPRVLADKRYPAWARALARCATPLTRIEKAFEPTDLEEAV